MEAPRREPAEYKGPVERERFEPRLVETEERGGLSRVLARDLTRWGPILGGVMATLATAILLSVLGAALGISAADASGAIWGGIVLLVSFFVGGYLAARTAGPGGTLTAVVNSALVWATSLVFGTLLAALGLGALVGLLGDAVPSIAGAAPGVTPAAAQTWAPFIGMLIALAAAIIGGLVGMHTEEEPRETRR